MCLVPTIKGCDPTYANQRKVGIVTEIRSYLYHIKWASQDLSPCWYQKKALVKLENEKNRINYLTDKA